MVADIYAVGIHLKTKPGDAGLVVGYSRTSYVFAEMLGQPQAAEGWHAFTVPLPGAAPKALHLESAGASAHRNYSNIGLTLGYRAFTLLARASATSSEISSLTYRPEQPSATRLRTCGEKVPCENLR